MEGVWPMSERTKATVRFWVEIGAIAFAIIFSYVTLSAKADQAIARIEKIEARESVSDTANGAMKSDIASMRTDIEVMKVNVQWIRQQLERQGR